MSRCLLSRPLISSLLALVFLLAAFQGAGRKQADGLVCGGRAGRAAKAGSCASLLLGVRREQIKTLKPKPRELCNAGACHPPEPFPADCL